MKSSTVAIALTAWVALTGWSAAVGQIRKPLAEPAEAVEPPWVETRKAEQLETVERFRAFIGFSFVDHYEESGIEWSNISTDDTGKRYKASHYDHGNGVAVADVDGDGKLDLYFSTQAGSNALLRNTGGRFEKLPGSGNLALASQIGVTASFADIDNDGDPDLYTTTVRGGNFLFENDGEGRFSDITEGSGLEHNGHSSGAVFFDYDRDGLLDLFLCNVGDYTLDTLITASTNAVNPEQGTEYRYWEAHKDAFSGHLKPERTERSIQGHDEYFENVEGKEFVLKTSAPGTRS